MSPNSNLNPVIVGQLDPSQANLLDKLHTMERDDPMRLSIEHSLGNLGLQGTVEGAPEFALVVKRDDDDNEIPSHYVNVTPDHPEFGTKYSSESEQAVGLPQPQVGYGKLSWRKDLLAQEAARKIDQATAEISTSEKALSSARKFIDIARDITGYAAGDMNQSDYRMNEMVLNTPDDAIQRTVATAVAAGAWYDAGLRTARIQDLAATQKITESDANGLDQAASDILQYRAQLAMDPNALSATVQSYIYNSLQSIPEDQKELRISLLALGAGATIQNEQSVAVFCDQIEHEARSK